MTTPIRWPQKPLRAAQIQPLFEALVAFLKQGYQSVSINASQDGSAINLGANAVDVAGNTFNYSERIISSRVTINPPGGSAGPGEAIQFAAVVTLADGSVDPAPALVWDVLAPAKGTVSPAGRYTAPAAVDDGSQDIVQVTNADGSSSAVSIYLHT